MAKIKFSNNVPYDKRRKRSYNYYKSENCFVCGVAAEVVHHMILIRNGGYDSGFNRICLCNSCHASIHDWLMDETIERKEMELVNELKRFC